MAERRAPDGQDVPRPAPARPRATAELALGLAVFAYYSAVAGQDWLSRPAAAAAHARDVLALERRLHLDVEPALNAWLAPHAVLRVLANYEYATTYVLSAFALLGWLWVRRPDLYRAARRSFVLLNVLGVTSFALYPLQPPRLLPASASFVDTVRAGHTWGSWGSPLVGHANQLAAMPSLHVAWAAWVSVVLARISGGWRTQLLSAAHVLLTVWVVTATANHYVVDVLAAFVLVVVSERAATWWSGRGSRARDSGGWDRGARARGARASGARVPPADAFFLYVERPDAPQQVGGVVLLDTTARPGGPPGRREVQALVRDRLGGLPRFRQRLDDRGRWRRPHWVPQDLDALDWDWHVPLVDLARPDGRPGGTAAFHALVAELTEQELPRDRPLWRLAVVHGIEPGVAGVVIVVHHVVADGIGTVAQALHLLEPELPPPAGGPRRPGRARTAAAVAVGLAQLATDGRPHGALPSSPHAARRFGTSVLPLEEVRAVARHRGVRVSDVLLTVVAAGLRRALLRAGHVPPDRLRVSVPLTVRDPRTAAEGNVTAAVFVDLPLGDVPEPARLAVVAERSAALRTPTRAVAARFAMQAAGVLLPPALHAVFARAVYGPRTFSGIVSNMPGPDLQLSLLGAPLLAAFPLLPLAPGVPLAVGALGWNGDLCVGIVVDPALLPDVDVLGEDIARALGQLRHPAGPPAGLVAHSPP